MSQQFEDKKRKKPRYSFTTRTAADYFEYVSLIIETDTAPVTSKIPEIKIIPVIDDPIAGNKAKLKQEAIICGKQILPLNNPRYVPIFFPDKALVSIVNGNVIIAAQAMPIKINEAISVH